jgi:diguanylate cyclase (GGDEF)-like protein
MAAKSWLCRDDMDRQRLLDMEGRIGPVRRVAMGVIALALLACGPWLGWWTLVPLAVAAAVFQAAERRAPQAARPEYVLFAAWAITELAIAAAVALSGGVESPALAWLALPVVTLSSRFSSRGVVVGVCVALGAVFVVGLGTGASAIGADPILLVAPVTLVICTAILSTALMRSDVQHRSETVIDPLTGMLNRKALATRVAELEQQSTVSGEPIGLVVGDLDHFKAVNDLCGHATGDAVLKEVAYEMRKELRAFDLAYRLGGEEFLVVLPGADSLQAERLAERLREALGATSFSGDQRVTMSFGVSASARGGRFDYQRVFGEADMALFEAKRSGRDRVRLADEAPVAATA